jgi:hypothetical protein
MIKANAANTQIMRLILMRTLDPPILAFAMPRRIRCAERTRMTALCQSISYSGMHPLERQWVGLLLLLFSIVSFLLGTELLCLAGLHGPPGHRIGGSS